MYVQKQNGRGGEKKEGHYSNYRYLTIAIDFLEFQLDFRPFSSMEGRVTPVSVRSWKIRIPSQRGGTLKKQ